MRPAHEAYARLRWTRGISLEQLDRVRVVVEDRMLGPVEVPLLGFEPGGRIPWSRVQAFCVGEQVAWDRPSRTDRLDEAVEALLSRQRERGEPGLTWDGLAWARTDGDPGGERRGLCVLTWNVLFDRYEPELVRTAERLPLLLEALRQSEADLVALQEVQAPLAARLLDEPWVRASYAVSASADDPSLSPYGQLLLSRWPVTRTRSVEVHGHKRLLIATVAAGEGEIEVAVVHLSSSRRPDAAARRARELDALSAAVGTVGPLVVLGDLNLDGPLPAALGRLGLEDAWLTARPGDPGPTFEPDRNPLARAMSPTGSPRRLDRVLVRGLGVRSASRIGREPLDLPPSDHCGVLVALDPGPLGAQPGSQGPGEAAVVLALPPELAAVIEPLRRRHDPRRWRWPPHLTLLHPAPAHGGLDLAAKALSEALSALPAARIALRGVEVLGGQAERAVSLGVAPEGASAVARIRSAVCRALGADDGPFVPHLTVGRLPPAEVPRLRERLSRLPPLSLSVRDVELWHRSDPSGPWHPWRRVPIGGGATTAAGPTTLAEALAVAGAVETPDREAAATEALRTCAELGLRAELVGSSSLGTALPESDIDVVVRAERPDEAVERLAARTGGRRVDNVVQTVRFSSAGWPCDAAVLPPDGPGPEDERDAVLASVRSAPAFPTVCRALKAWAEARQVGDPAFGFPGGLAWTIAVAAVAPGAADDSGPEAWLIRAIERLLEPEPIGLGSAPFPEPEGPPPTIAPIYTAAPPRQIVARHLLPATAAIVHAELESALLHAWDGRWSEALRPLLGPGPGPVVRASLSAADPAVRAAALGWLRRRACALLASLLPTAAAVRPWPRPVPRSGGFEVSWSLIDPERAAVARVMDTLRDRWTRSEERPEGATLQLSIEIA